ncbi:MAG TPA: glycosyltransferase [Aggregatilinea sp.]|uniref:glycosyltransferase n=1 Tax=Aggregatilinea sp. TaxID=2806333 RepID=UPI002B956A46|nr:glycosyltransferase [Aggregatilinea sp.]HML24738.1 glycosyltransferase [Aggregatilinea sp.]
MNLTLVHDWLNQIGGAEDVLEHLVGFYPEAPVFTSMYAPGLMPPEYRDWDIRSTWMDRLPGIHTHHQRYLPLYPLAFDRLDLSAYDVVLSNKSGFCHGVHTGPETLHICYCLTPTRYIWELDGYLARENFGRVTRLAAQAVARLYHRWDFAAAQKVDHFIAISTEIRERIRRYYHRESSLIYPPVEAAERFTPSPTVDDYFLIVSRLIPYKRIDLAVEACTRLDLPLVVAGKGRDRERLEALAGPTVQFLGYVPDDDLPDLFARCRAFIFPGLEDFGIAPVQAQAAGRPVIAYKGGGALDTVIPGKTGAFFDQPTVDSLAATLRAFDASTYDPAAVREHAMQFDSEVFKRQMMDTVEREWARFSTKRDRA